MGITWRSSFRYAAAPKEALGADHRTRRANCDIFEPPLDDLRVTTPLS